MAESPGSTKLFPALFAALVILHVALLAASRLYPSVDLPDHLAAATIARDAGDPTNQFSRYYALDERLQPNTFHLFFCALKIFPSVELANRLFFCIYAILLPLSVLLIIRKAGGDPWFSLFSFLFIYNINVTWGFVGFAFAIPLTLLFYYFFLLEPGGMSTPLRRILAALALCGLFFVHLLAALFAILALLSALAWRARRGARRTLSGLAVAAPLMVLVLVWWHSQRAPDQPSLSSFLSAYYRSTFAETLGNRWGILIFDNSALQGSWMGRAVALFFSSAVLLPAFVLATSRSRRAGSAGGPGGARGSTVAGAEEPRREGALLGPLLLASLLCALLLPNGIPGQPILYERFSSLLMLSVALVASRRTRGLGKRFFSWAVPAVCAIHLALWADYFIAFNRENAGFNAAFLPDAGGGRRLAGIIYDYDFRRKPVYVHFPSYYVVWKRGVTPMSIIDYRFGALRRKASFDTLPYYLVWVGRLNNLDDRYRDMNYLLARGDIPAGAGGFVEGFSRTRSAGAWSIYERAAAPP